MSAWEEIGSTYAEAATQVLPLHRAVVFAVGFLISLAVQQQTHLSILETLAVVPLSEFVSFDKGILAKATAGNILWAILAIFMGVALSKIFIRFAYALVDHVTGASAKAASLDKSWLLGLSIEDRKSALELVDSGLIEPRARLRALTGINELLVGIGAVCSVAAFWGNMLDGALGVAALIGAICTHIFAIHVFLADYFGPAMTKAHLQGKPPPNLTKLK